MNKQEKDACKRSLKVLHKLWIHHGDVHFKNFILLNTDDGEKKAIIIDFGRSTIAAGKKKLKEEEKVLNLKLEQGDDSMDQNI
jgi:tRNA A-37 threonylcarbamoyl transferase component Bud32